MASLRDIRRLAFQCLYQLDARPSEEPDAVITSMMDDLEDPTEFSNAERRKATSLAVSAYAARAAADAFMNEIAPAWPSYRQAAVDRAILRLAHYEMTSGTTHPKIAVNEAVELAKQLSTDDSPGFVNGVLGQVMLVTPQIRAAAQAVRGDRSGG